MNPIEDLLGDAAAEKIASYFDPREFAERESLESSHYWHLYRREVLRTLIESDGTPARAIELGCGTGNVATHLNRNGHHVDYGDVHTEGLEAARRRLSAALGADADRRFVRLDVTAQFPKPADYDAVYFFDVLEHLPDDVATLKSVRANIPSGTRLVFTVPAFQALWSPWDDLQHHKRRYTTASARALATESGFEVERATYFFFPLFFAAGGVKVLRQLRSRLFGEPPPVEFTELTEAKSNAALNAAMLRLLSLESRWLRSRDLPCGTSVYVTARAR